MTGVEHWTKDLENCWVTVVAAPLDCVACWGKLETAGNKNSVLSQKDPYCFLVRLIFQGNGMGPPQLIINVDFIFKSQNIIVSLGPAEMPVPDLLSPARCC